MRMVSTSRASFSAVLTWSAIALLGSGIPQQSLAATESTGTTATTSQAPLDHASGHTTGRRAHRPIMIVREVDKASPVVATPPSKGHASGTSSQNGGDGAAKGQATE